MIGAVLGSIGGAAQGFGPAMDDVLGRRQQRGMFDDQQAQRQGEFEQTQAATKGYRDEQLGLERERVDIARGQAEGQRAYQRRAALAAKQAGEVDAMRERRLADGTNHDERADRALNAAEAVARLEARRPVSGDFGNYAQYRQALDQFEESKRGTWRTFGFESPEQAAEFMPGGSYLKPSNHARPNPLSQIRQMQNESGQPLREISQDYHGYGDFLRPGG